MDDQSYVKRMFGPDGISKPIANDHTGVSEVGVSALQESASFQRKVRQNYDQGSPLPKSLNSATDEGDHDATIPIDYELQTSSAPNSVEKLAKPVTVSYFQSSKEEGLVQQKATGQKGLRLNLERALSESENSSSPEVQNENFFCQLGAPRNDSWMENPAVGTERPLASHNPSHSFQGPASIPHADKDHQVYLRDRINSIEGRDELNLPVQERRSYIRAYPSVVNVDESPRQQPRPIEESGEEAAPPLEATPAAQPEQSIQQSSTTLQDSSSRQRSDTELDKDEHYSDSTLQQKKAMMLWVRVATGLNLFYSLMNDTIQISEAEGSELVLLLPRALCVVLLVPVVFFWLKKDPSQIIIALTLLQIRWLLTPYTQYQTPESLVEQLTSSEGESKADRDRGLADYANFLLQQSILFVPIFYNTFMAVIALRKVWKKIVFALATFMTSIGAILNHFPKEVFESKEAVIRIVLVMGATIILTIIFAIAAINVERESIKFIIYQKSANDQFKRIIQSVEEAMIIIREAKVDFTNKTADSLFFPDKVSSEVFPEDLEDLLQRKRFYLYSQIQEEQHQSSDDLRSHSLQQSQISKQAQVAFSFNDLMLKPSKFVTSAIFTFHKEAHNLGLNTQSAQNKLQKVMEELRKKKMERGVSHEGFDFFMIKFIRLEKGKNMGQTKEVAIQLIDFSEKILVDSLNTERKYLSYINATVSHEMRNPLNSINAQIQNQRDLLSEMQDALTKEGDKEQSTQLIEEMSQCLDIQVSSCKLMNFNVEDILALPLLKEGRLAKNVQMHNIKKSVQEVKSIQAWSAQQKGVAIMPKYHGFPQISGTLGRVGSETGRLGLDINYEVPIDEQRFQQVLLNYQSNALKFMKEAQGRILVLLQYVRAHPPQASEIGGEEEEVAYFKKQVEAFYEENIVETSSPYKVLAPDPYHLLREASTDKIVLSVFDNGIGIPEKERDKLYKLFSCLQSSRSMNAKGIGLGLVISKMISEEYGGGVQVHSKYRTGSIFQSSFAIHSSNDEAHLFQDLKIDSFQQFSSMSPRARVSSLDPSKQESFVKVAIRNYKRQQMKRCIENLTQMELEKEAFEHTNKRILIIDDEPYNCMALYSLIKGLKLSQVEDRIDLCLSGTSALRMLLQNIRPRTKKREVRPAKDPLQSLLVAGQSIGEGQNSSSLDEVAIDDSNLEKLLELLDRTKTIGDDSNRNTQALRSILAEHLQLGSDLVCDYSLILSDCSMPFMDGYQCINYMKRILYLCGILEGKEMPSVLAVTGHVEFEYQLKAFQAGMDTIYPKPMTSELISYILLEHKFKFKVPEAVVKEVSQKKRELLSE